MDEQPTRSPAEEFRAEMARRGMVSTPETREWARKALADARAAWPPERFDAVRARTRRAVAEMFGHEPSDTTAA
ncbi:MULTISPECIES: hypothetical protein [unclassified Micromonospora]|uniref:hypothetical protein n=1 Tax=unclassified Micromonospora TaxID=2617518 RepID=UPI003320B79A